jgi:SAM-dependent methyltransferase
MQEVLRAAEELGWQTALETHVKPKNPAVLDLILDKRRSRFLEVVEPPQYGVAVDIGCGYGGISLQLAQRYRQVFSLDSGLERLGFLNVIRKQEHIHNIRAIHHDNIASLPFADNSVDIIILVGVFEYLPLSYPQYSIKDVQQRVMREMYRVLKAGGCLYIGTKNRLGWPYWKGGADHNRLRFGPILPRVIANRLTQYLYGKPYRIIVDSLPSYRKLLKDAGFGNARFYWPIPGYQFPDTFVSLDRDAERNYRFADDSPISSWKKFVISGLQASGILKFVVPHFSIVAKKD